MNAPDDEWGWIDHLFWEGWPKLLAIAVAILACLAMAISALADEPIRGVQFDCATLGRTIANVAKFREVEANEEKTIALYRAMNSHLGGPHLAVLERAIRRLWREGLTAEAASWALYKRCQAQLGDMGLEG